MRFEESPLGKIVQGSVWDCNKNNLERALKRYDPRLYIKWNPSKREGHGVWEIRIKPTKKTRVDHGGGYSSLEWIESDLIHHVLDVPVLHYGLLDKIYEMDAYRFQNYGAHLDEELDKYEAKVEKTRWDNIRHQMKLDKKYWDQWKELVSQGYNPLWFLK